MPACPNCGSERLVLLTFTSAQGDEAPDLPERPVAKCAACGHKLTAREVTAKEDASIGPLHD